MIPEKSYMISESMRWTNLRRLETGTTHLPPQYGLQAPSTEIASMVSAALPNSSLISLSIY